MIGDPNWLYSTIAQSSAAIVAIIGGFITATILSRRAEKTSLQNELSDKKAQLKGLRSYSPPTIYKSRATAEEIQSRKEQMDSIREKISLLTAEIRELESRLKTFAYPPNLGRGIGVLAYLAAFGILLPVLIIAYEAFSGWTRVFTTFTFWLGIIGVFVYIVLQIRTLRRYLMPQAKIGVIGGTGLYDIEGLTDIEEVNIDTPFGKPSDTITIGKLEGVGITTTRLVVVKPFESLPGFFR